MFFEDTQSEESLGPDRLFAGGAPRLVRIPLSHSHTGNSLFGDGAPTSMMPHNSGRKLDEVMTRSIDMHDRDFSTVEAALQSSAQIMDDRAVRLGEMASALAEDQQATGQVNAQAYQRYERELSNLAHARALHNMLRCYGATAEPDDLARFAALVSEGTNASMFSVNRVGEFNVHLRATAGELSRGALQLANGLQELFTRLERRIGNVMVALDVDAHARGQFNRPALEQMQEEIAAYERLNQQLASLMSGPAARSVTSEQASYVLRQTDSLDDLSRALAGLIA